MGTGYFCKILVSVRVVVGNGGTRVFETTISAVGPKFAPDMADIDGYELEMAPIEIDNFKGATEEELEDMKKQLRIVKRLFNRIFSREVKRL